LQSRAYLHQVANTNASVEGGYRTAAATPANQVDPRGWTATWASLDLEKQRQFYIGVNYNF